MVLTALNLARANLAHRPLASLLTVCMLSVAVALISLFLQTSAHVSQRIDRDLARVDLVVGAKGSPLQIILSSLLHVDVPTGNIPLTQAQAVMQHPLVAASVPIALGDSFRGFRLVGTTPEMLPLYGASLRQGRDWQARGDVVIGADIASSLGMTLGQRFVSVHGLGQSDAASAHDHAEYRVVGIAARSGTVLDRLILTSIDSVWAAHGLAPGGLDLHHGSESEDHHDHEHHREDHDYDHDHDTHHHERHTHEEGEDHHEVSDPHEGASSLSLADLRTLAPEGLEITALLVTYRSPIAAVRLTEDVQRMPGLQAASPAREITRLFQVSAGFLAAARMLAGLLLCIGGLSIFTALSSAAQQKTYDFALLRAMGGRPSFVLLSQLFEGGLLAILSAVTGIVGAHGALWGVSALSPAFASLGLDGSLWPFSELLLILGVLVLGAAAALWPALRAFRTDPALLLQQGR